MHLTRSTTLHTRLINVTDREGYFELFDANVTAVRVSYWL